MESCTSAEMQLAYSTVTADRAFNCAYISLKKKKKKVKLTTLVESDPKTPFSIAPIPRCRKRALLLSQDCSTSSLPYNAEC